MMTQLTKSGGKWAIEVSCGPHDKPLVKTFASREVAEKWRYDVASGKIAAPVLQPKRARTAKGKYKGDNKGTLDVNEAYAGGKAPVKAKPKAKSKKK
jgi:hypothetical protein|tara:strand:+ start:9717 stop:10007 length:291 start_codon:yes stop_codon:yes gene_type:complete